MYKLNIALGNGLGFNDNSITTSWSQSKIDDKDIKQPDGLYIPNLKGADGSGGGTIVDNHTLKEKSLSDGASVNINRDVVQLIFAMSVCKTQTNGRYNGNIPIVSGKKTATDIKNEINFVFDNGSPNPYTTYAVRKNDLLMLYTGGTNSSGGLAHTFNNGYAIMEDGNRYVDQTAVALFIVNSVTNSASNGLIGYVEHITLECLWSADGYYTKGQKLQC